MMLDAWEIIPESVFVCTRACVRVHVCVCVCVYVHSHMQVLNHCIHQITIIITINITLIIIITLVITVIETNVILIS